MRFLCISFLVVLLLSACSNQSNSDAKIGDRDSIVKIDSSNVGSTTGWTVYPPNSAEAMLMEFYKTYIQLSLNMPPNFDQIDPWINQHCTNAYIQYLDTAELDFDPFINAQDLSEAWVNNIKIVKSENHPYQYTVILNDPNNDNATTMIVLEVKLVDGQYKIANITL